jgi:hypothetical protein
LRLAISSAAGSTLAYTIGAETGAETGATYLLFSISPVSVLSRDTPSIYFLRLAIKSAAGSEAGGLAASDSFFTTTIAPGGGAF